MDFLEQQICDVFIQLNEYVSGGYVYDVDKSLCIVKDVKTKKDAIEKIKEFKINYPKLNRIFKKIETSKELRRVFFSNLHDVQITKFKYINNTISMKLDLSENFLPILFNNKLLDDIILNFDNVDNFNLPKKDLINRRITRLDIDINDEDYYEFYFETYDFTSNSANINECVSFSFKCSDLHFSDGD